MTEAETLLGKPLIETLPTDPDPGEIRKIRVGTDNDGVFTGKSFAVFIASRPELET
jgi:putative transposase